MALFLSPAAANLLSHQQAAVDRLDRGQALAMQGCGSGGIEGGRVMAEEGVGWSGEWWWGDGVECSGDWW